MNVFFPRLNNLKRCVTGITWVETSRSGVGEELKVRFTPRGVGAFAGDRCIEMVAFYRIVLEHI